MHYIYIYSKPLRAMPPTLGTYNRSGCIDRTLLTAASCFLARRREAPHGRSVGAALRAAIAAGPSGPLQPQALGSILARFSPKLREAFWVFIGRSATLVVPPI